MSVKLKVPHARNPEGTIALFFHPQSVYCAPLSGNQSAASAAKGAHTLGLDPRFLSVEYLVRSARERCI